MLLEDRVCVVSGVGPGLGRQVALGLAGQGAHVVLSARTESVLRQVASEVEGLGRKALVVPADITDKSHCQHLATTTAEQFGRIDVLVNNVFLVDNFQTFRKVDLDDWRRLVEVNLFGSLQVTQAIVPHMQHGQGASIVFLNSMVVRKPRPQEGGYSIAKGGLLIAARQLAKELGRFKIRVNSVLPGWMWGPQVKQYVEYLAEHRGVPTSEIVAEITGDIALGEIPTDEQVAGAVVFLASDLASAVTGHALDANGGEVFA